MIVTELLGSMNDEAGRALVGQRHVERVLCGDRGETDGDRPDFGSLEKEQADQERGSCGSSRARRARSRRRSA